MNCSNPTATLFAIVAVACLANATQSIGARFSRSVRLEVGKHDSGSTRYAGPFRYRRPDGGESVQVLYRFGTKSLFIDCSSAHCLVVLSSAGEA